MTISRITSRLAHRFSLRRFLGDEKASVTIEALAAISIMTLGLTSFFYFWSAYQAENRVQKATYTVSDLISRQRGTTITKVFLDGMENTAEFLMHNDQNALMRFTQVRRVSGTATSSTGLAVDWSYSPCGARTALTTSTVNTIYPKLPMIDLGAALVVVELTVDYSPGFTYQQQTLGKMTFNGFLAAMPRFEQQFSLTGNGVTNCIG